jgi:hypothetical protein
MDHLDLGRLAVRDHHPSGVLPPTVVDVVGELQELRVAVAVAGPEGRGEPLLLAALPEFLLEDVALMLLGKEQEEVPLAGKNDRLDEGEPFSVLVGKKAHAVRLGAWRELRHRGLSGRAEGEKESQAGGDKNPVHSGPSYESYVARGRAASARYTPAAMRRVGLLVALFALACASRRAPPAIVSVQNPQKEPASTTAAPDETPVDTDEYTRYELLAPETAQFHILYEVTAIGQGAEVFFNPIRKGSVASGERVTDRMTGEDLRFEVVSGEEARRTGLPRAEIDTDYIRIRLPRPVPAEGGQVRLLIEKTYRDAKSYTVDGDAIVLTRSLGIKRNSILLPAGYELVSCNVPSQVLAEPDGRILVSFVNAGPGPAPLTLRARRLR